MSDESTSNTININVKKMAADYEALVKGKSIEINKPLGKYIEMPITENNNANSHDDIDLKIVNNMLTDIINDILKINR